MIKSFKNAFNGIKQCLFERNFIIHIIIAILVVLAGILLKISKMEFLIIILTIAIVLVLEVINTAIEKSMDVITEEYHEKIRIVKDISAGAVLIGAIFSVVVGVIIFGSYLW